MYKVLDESQIDYQAWENFVQNNKDGSIFHTPEMTKVFQEDGSYKSFAFFVVDEEKNNIEALMTGFIQNVKSGVLKSISSRSVLMQTPIYNNLQALKFLLDYYSKYMKNKAVYTEIRNHHLQNSDEKEIYENCGFNLENHLNILVPLGMPEEDLWKTVKRNRKDGINKGKKAGFSFTVSGKCDDIELFYKLLEELYQKIKLPIPKLEFYENLSENENSRWFTLKYNNDPIIILCALSYKEVLFAYTIGIKQDEQITKLRPVDFFYWEVIRWANNNSYNIYDWMGAGKPDKEYGVRKFKLQYGGNLLDLGRYVYIHSKNKYFIANKGFALMQKVMGRI